MKSLTLDAKKKGKDKFKASLSAEREFYKSLKKVAESSANIIEHYTDTLGIKNLEKMMSDLKDYSEKIGPWAARQSAKLLEQVQRSNKLAYQKNNKAMAAELKTGKGELNTIKAARVLMEEQVGLIKSIPLEAGQRAQKIAFEAALQGQRAVPDEDTINELMNQLGSTREVAVNRAKLIAVTETARSNASINQARAVAVGSDKYIWRNSQDAAVRHSHKTRKGKPLDGQVFSWDDPPLLDDGTRGHPGTFPRCFPGDEILDHTPFVQKIYRYEYEGEMTELIFDDGTSIRATVNHPVLGSDGMTAINHLHIGDEVVYHTPEKSEDFQITFEDLFNASLKHSLFKHSQSDGADFHGDETRKAVDVLSIDYELVFEIGQQVIEKMKRLGLTLADIGFINLILSGMGNYFDNAYIDFESLSSFLKKPDHFLNFLKSNFTPKSIFCFILHSNIEFKEHKANPINFSYNDFKIFRDVSFAYRILIHGYEFIETELYKSQVLENHITEFFIESRSVDYLNFIKLTKCNDSDYKMRRIVEKKVFKYIKYVFNLQTATGYYISKNTLSLNCRCYAEPLFDD